MDTDQFNRDLEELCNKHGITTIGVELEDLTPYRCAVIGGLHDKDLCPLKSKRGGTNISIELYTANSLVIKP